MSDTRRSAFRPAWQHRQVRRTPTPMHSRLLDEDPLTLTRRIHHYDPVTGKSTIETKQFVDDMIEDAKGVHRQFDERTPWKGTYHRVASIPLSVFSELQKKGIPNDPKAFKTWLNDRDNSVFRTRPGRV